jgi:hypothetical protein
MVRHLSPVVTKAVAVLVFGCALLALPARANAQDAAAAGGGALGQGFGDKGQLAISGELGTSFDKVNHGGWTFLIKPAGDYFVIPSVSLGGFAALVLGNNSRTEEGVGVRAGYNLNVTPNIGVWPKAGVAYDHASVASGQTTVSTSTTWVTVDAPIMFHIIPHLFVGLGPYYYLKVAGDGNTGYGVHSLVGGWF